MLIKCKSYNYVITFVYLLLVSCSSEAILELPLDKKTPDQESWDVTIILTDKGIMRAKIQSGHLEKYNEKSFVFLDKNVLVDFFDNEEDHTSILTSDYAEVNQKSNDMKASGNVIAISDSGITLYSDILIWNAEEEKLYTNEKIMITTLEKDTLYGVGFESNSNLENWKILNPSGVSGKEFK